MGLTPYNKENFLVGSKLPHYFVVTRGPDWQRHCGTLKDAERVLDLYPDANVKQVFQPVPTTVDVPHITVKDQELPMQQILPESELQEFNP